MINEKKINLNRYKTVIQNVLITLFIILLFHTLSVITLPGIDLGNFTTGGGYSFTNMLNLLAGGGLTRMSMLAIGLGPYITAQIIMQLLSADLIPAFTRLSKQGERGKKVLEIYTRLLTLPFCMAQSYSIIALILQSSSTTSVTVLGYSDIGDIPFNELFTLMLIFTAGTYLSIFFADMITKRGIGNGVTLLILSGIIASFFSDFFVAFETIASKLDSSTKFKELTTILSCVLYVLIYIIVLMFVIFINNSVRKIPIQQLGHGLITNSEHLPFLPIKVNSAGVIPVIFATSIMTIPGTIAQFLSESSEIRWFIIGDGISKGYLTLESWSGLSLYCLFIILFTFFYSYIQINPPLIAENFEKSGRFIPGIRIGNDTEKYITKVLNKVNYIGAPFLALIAAIPYIISFITSIPVGISVGGTGIIIIVAASHEFWCSLQSVLTTSGYTFSKNKIKSKNYESSTFEL